jgi:hypothetical protein
MGGMKKGAPEMATRKQEPHRRLFHTFGGGLDLSRLVEQLIPAVVIGGIVIYANTMVTSNQVGDLKAAIARSDATTKEQQQKLDTQSEKLAAISAQLTAFLGQQLQLNTSIDARMTYLERSKR